MKNNRNLCTSWAGKQIRYAKSFRCLCCIISNVCINCIQILFHSPWMKLIRTNQAIMCLNICNLICVSELMPYLHNDRINFWPPSFTANFWQPTERQRMHCFCHNFKVSYKQLQPQQHIVAKKRGEHDTCVQNTVPMNTEKCTHLTIRHGWRFGSNDGGQFNRNVNRLRKNSKPRSWGENEMIVDLLNFIWKFPVCVCVRVCAVALTSAPFFATVELSLISHLSHSHFVSFEIRHAHFFAADARCSVGEISVRCCESR